MPTLEWIGKKAVVNHHREVPFHLLEEVPELSYGEKDSGNLLVQGDNLVALKALLPYYAGKVKCIYIDPPYNTGNESWVYNDNVNDPQILEWLGKTVGKESEDLTRHDKWLCMMYPRIQVLRDLLAEDGAIFISIDDDENHYLKAMCDEIFGRNNFVTNVIWEKKFSPQNDAKWLSDSHDHILVYAFKKDVWRPNLLPRTEEMDNRYKNPDNDTRGPWTSSDLTVKTYNKNCDYPITLPSGRISSPTESRCWGVNEKRFKELVADNRIWFGKTGNNMPRLKKFLSEVQGGMVSKTIWYRKEVGDNQEAKRENKIIFANDSFSTPKPEKLIQRMIHLSTQEGDIVLDSFLGSGTTCAVAQKMGRKWIGVEMGEHCKTHCFPRMQKICDGEQGGISKTVNWKGGSGFRYYRLGNPLFDESGKVYDGVRFSHLARHVYFTETGQPLENKNCDSPLIGEYNETAIYLLFNGILKDKKPNSGNVLTNKILEILPEYAGTKVIYGTACRISPAKLKEKNIIFKQIPYDINVG